MLWVSSAHVLLSFAGHPSRILVQRLLCSGETNDVALDDYLRCCKALCGWLIMMMTYRFSCLSVLTGSYGHRGSCSTVLVLQNSISWSVVTVDVKNFVNYSIQWFSIFLDSTVTLPS